MIQANAICSRFHYGTFSQTGTVVQAKFVFKHHLYCKDASSFLGLFLHFKGYLIDSQNFYEKTQAWNQAILTPIKKQELKHLNTFTKTKQIALILLLLCEVLLQGNSILSSDWLMPGCHDDYKWRTDSRGFLVSSNFLSFAKQINNTGYSETFLKSLFLKY